MQDAAGNNPVEGDIVEEKRLRVADRCEHSRHLFGDGRQNFAGRALAASPMTPPSSIRLASNIFDAVKP